MERVQIPTSETCHVCGAPMVLKFGKTGQFLGCSKYPECKATRPHRRPASRRGGQKRARLSQVLQAAPDPRKQARREIPFVLGLPRVQGILQHRRRGKPRPRRWSRPNSLARNAANRWSCVRARGAHSWDAPDTPSAATPCLSTTRVARSDGESRGRVPEMRRAHGGTQRPTRCVPGLSQVPQVPRDRSGARRSQGPDRRRRPRPAKASKADDLKSIPVEETCEQLRRADARPARPPRILPRAARSIPNARDHAQPGEATLAKINELTKT